LTLADHSLLTCEDKANECDIFNGTHNIDVSGDHELHTCVRLQINATNFFGISNVVAKGFLNYTKIIAVGLNFTKIFEEAGSNQTWPGLEIVCTARNSVKRLERNSFLQAWNAKLIDLSKNQIAYIHTDAFAGLGDLKILYLDQNRIEHLFFFKVLTGLETLDLSHNLITNVAESTFATNQKLKVLELQGNQIATIDPKAFQPLKQMTSLDLSSNPLAMLEVATFCGLRNLTKLNLANTSLPENEFYFGVKNFSQTEILNLTMPCYVNISRTEPMYNSRWTQLVFAMMAMGVLIVCFSFLEAWYS
jgi:Leucine rich repeat